MKKRLTLIYLILAVQLIVNGQTKLSDTQFLEFKNIPQESIYLHFNSSVLFTGEYLFYKAYTLNATSNAPSDVSKIAYIELIDINKASVFKHKIHLTNGMGFSDFYITPSIPSGNYKLIAYTRWMRNFGKDNYFKTDLTIINPFQTNHSFVDTTRSETSSIKEVNTLLQKTNALIRLKTNKASFSKRELVTVNIEAIQAPLSFGNYSLSVKKIDSMLYSLQNRTFKSNTTDKRLVFSNKNLVYLPEMRGELLSGHIIDKNNNNNVAAYKPISLSISGKKPIFKTSITNSSGRFYFNLFEPYNTNEATLQIATEDTTHFTIKLDEDPPIDFSNLEFRNFKITEALRPLIQKHSRYSQIENAYANLKTNTPIVNEDTPIFYEGVQFTYNLDDYTRFKTVKETIVEIINELTVQKVDGKNKLAFKSYTFDKNTLSSLVLVDGNILKNHDDLFNYNAKKIDKISLVNSKYRYGGKTYNGIISIMTFKKDFSKTISQPNNKVFNIKKVQERKRYFSPNYHMNASNLNRIPDYRTQLLWEPNILLEDKSTAIKLYTSDVTGHYEITLQGVTKQGTLVSVSQMITVK
ncbi:hypothetical protein MHTCC0001_12070 [Flavobacteriaceae bacterium MHTCC 0001]